MLSQFCTKRGSASFTISEEGVAAQFCTDSRALFDGARAEITRLNGDVNALRAALDSVDAIEVECGERQ